MWTIRRTLAALGLVVLATGETQAADAPITAGVTPFVSLPLGRDTELFRTGGGADLAFLYAFERTPWAAGATAGYAWVPTVAPGTTLSVASLGVQAGGTWPVYANLSVGTQVSAGGFFARLNQTPGTGGANPWYGASAGLEWTLGGTWIVSAEAGYRAWPGLLNEARVAVSLKTSTAGPTSGLLEFRSPPGYTPLLKDKRGLKLAAYRSAPIFPVFLKYYDNHPLGQVILHNYETQPAQQIALSLEMKGFMDGPRDLAVVRTLGPGRDATVDLQALFNERLLTVAEATKQSLTLTLTYTQGGRTNTEVYTPTVVVQHRNGMTWDDDRHFAAFVSSRDPAAFGFSRGVLAVVRESLNPAVNPEIQTAIAFQSALRQSGLVYVKDPASAFNNRQSETVDSLQFPQETLGLRSGDCDDLTILWCALLESVGIETAAFTLPGHILPAFALTASPREALELWGSEGDFVVRDGKVWVPFEATLLQEGFASAWKAGTRQLREQNGAWEFFSLREAWQTFPPVVISGTAVTPPLPPSARLTAEVKASVSAYVQQVLAPRTDKLQAELKKAPVSQRLRLENKLGILYAQFGQYGPALEAFRKLAADGYRPALINQGNIFLLTKQPKAALEAFQAALKTQADDRAALSGVVLAYQDLGDQQRTKAAAERLALAEKSQGSPSLGTARTVEGGRAAEITGNQGLVQWNE